MKNTDSIAAVLGFVLTSLIIALWFESGVSYRNLVAPVGQFKFIFEVENYAIDFQLSGISDSILNGIHGYRKGEASECSIFGKFKLFRVLGLPDSRIPYFSRMIFPVWIFSIPSIALFLLGIVRVLRKRVLRNGSGNKV